MARFRGKVYKKALPRDANDLQVIREDTKRKFARSDFQRPITQEIIRVTEDLFIPEPITPITISPLTDSATIFTPGLVPSGSSTSLGPFRPRGFETGGPDESPVYQVNADNQGLHARNVWKTIDPTRGAMSIWLRSHDASGSGTNNYVFNVGDNLVVRYESGTGQLRFYPDLTTDPSVFMFIDAIDWWPVDGTWNELRVAWDYANQDWKMTWGEMEGTRSGSNIVTFPGWNEFTYVSFFTDLNNANNIYHDCSFLNVGPAEFDPVAMLRLTDMVEPTGFVNRADSTIAFSDSGPDRTFTITPSGTSFSYYIGAIRYSKSVPETVQLTDTDGLWWIYYDADALTSVHAPTHNQIKDIFLTSGSVAVVYWNSTLGEGKLFEERHGGRMSGDQHVLHHETIGMAYDIGLALGNILPDESGGLDSHAQFSNTSGQVFDEDIEFDILAVASTTGLEIFYMDAAGTWTWTTNAGFSVTDDGVGTRLAYNQIGVGLTEVSNNSFVLYHVFATNIESNELIAIVGQEEYSNISAAQRGAETEILNIVLGDLVTEEMLPIATVILQTSDSYGNAVKARIRTTNDGDDYIDWRRKLITGGGVISDSDEKVAVDSAAIPGYIGATSGTGVLRVELPLTKTDGGDFVTLRKGSTTYIGTYPQAKVADFQWILVNRTWQDETINSGSFVNQVDYPRRIVVTCANADLISNMTGTVTINAIDADGVTIQDVITVDVPPGPPVEFTSTHAVALINSIVTDQTDAHLGDQYAVGIDDVYGVPNYPITSIFKAAVEGLDNGITLISATYGLVQLNPIAVVPADIAFFYRSAR